MTSGQCEWGFDISTSCLIISYSACANELELWPLREWFTYLQPDTGGICLGREAELSVRLKAFILFLFIYLCALTRYHNMAQLGKRGNQPARLIGHLHACSNLHQELEDECRLCQINPFSAGHERWHGFMCPLWVLRWVMFWSYYLWGAHGCMAWYINIHPQLT